MVKMSKGEGSARLVLATESRYKRELMDRLGLEYVADAAHVDEARIAQEHPQSLAERLARAKAEAVALRHPGAWVIGGDQVIALGDRIYSKPGDAAGACAQLAELAGRTHQLITAVCVVAPGGQRYAEAVVFEMCMRPLDASAIAVYVAEDAPHDCAGAYRIEAGGIRLFESLAGDDYTAIIGLPLTRVWSLLERSGFFAGGLAG